MDTQQNISLSAEELRTIVLESGKFIPNQHRRILLNLLDLQHITVDDIMTPKARMEVLNMGRPIEAIIEQLETCYHNKLPVFDNDQEAVLGILHIRKTLALLSDPDAFNKETLRTLLTPAYYIPSGTHVLQQLQYFQENHARLGLIVNEYGEVQGLITVEDIIEEMIGKFTTSQPGTDAHVAWDTQGCYVTDAGVSLRELNRQLKINLPLDGPKTLNGLLLESLREIPDASVSIKIANCAMDVLQIDNQVIKTVRIHQPTPQHLNNKRSNHITE
jgi:Mg2+/Co2+ transporter CorB